jgi:hypothetical protein
MNGMLPAICLAILASPIAAAGQAGCRSLGRLVFSLTEASRVSQDETEAPGP